MTIQTILSITPQMSFIPFHYDFVDSTLVERFEQAVEKFSGLTAIAQADRELSFRELNQAANRLAHALLARLEPGEAPVILLMDDKTASIIAILAVLKAGRIYLSLEPARPVEHLEKIFKDAGPALVICNSASQSVARQVAQAGVDILNLDLLEDGFSDENPNIPLSPESKAVIFYTSGSTGEPKGVVDDHLGALHFAWIKINATERAPGDRVPLALSFSYGWSLDLIFATLFSGATVYPCDLTRMSLGAFSDWLIQQRITIVPCPASFFSPMVGFPFGERADAFSGYSSARLWRR